MIHPRAGGKKHWMVMVDEVTDYTHSFFLKKKSDLVETMIGVVWIKNIFMKYHIRIKKIKLDNNGKNLPSKNKSTKFGNKIEFTAPGTPQQNSVVE